MKRPKQDDYEMYSDFIQALEKHIDQLEQEFAVLIADFEIQKQKLLKLLKLLEKEKFLKLLKLLEKEK